MKTILVVDDDGKFQRIVVDGLKAYGSVTSRQTKDLIVKSASDGKEAASALNRFKIDLVVTDIEGSAVDGLGLITYMKQGAHKDIPVVVVTATSSAETKSKLEALGVTHYMKKPFVLLELMEKMLDALDETPETLISDFTVPNFLQALKMEKKSCTLQVTSEGKAGHLHLENGELIDAETNGLTGDGAAVEILGWENTDLKVEALSSNKKRIEAPIMHLLMQAAHARERKAEAARTPDSVLDEIVILADSGHDKEALKKLTAFIKANPKNHEGWLWYSRITDKMESIEKSLNNAKKVAPKDPEVIKEIEKFELAKKELEGEEFSRCPFCWALLNGKVLECPYCHAYLFINEDLLTHPESKEPEILQGAVDRYMKVVNREENPDAYYYLGIAHLNLRQWNKAIDQLHKTAETFPEKGFYTDQLEMLLGLLTSSKDLFAKETLEKEIGSDVAPTDEEEAEDRKVLVVESSPTIRKVISITLSKRGYEVVEAQDGLEAVNCLDKTRPHMILMDSALGKIGAQEVLSVVRETSALKDVPVIVLTGKGGLFSGGKKKLAGATASLSKPFDLPKLLKITEKYLQ